MTDIAVSFGCLAILISYGIVTQMAYDVKYNDERYSVRFGRLVRKSVRKEEREAEGVNRSSRRRVSVAVVGLGVPVLLGIVVLCVVVGPLITFGFIAALISFRIVTDVICEQPHESNIRLAEMHGYASEQDQSK